MILVGGIHGVGKTYYCKKMSTKMDIPYYSASNLVKNRIIQDFSEKKVENIDNNQDVLIEEINVIRQKHDDFILDGHMTLIDTNGKIRKLPKKVFKELKINDLIIIIDKVEEIQKRMLERDGLNWDYEFIEAFQNSEISYARKIASELNLNLRIIKAWQNHELGENIILPIKPVYAEKILNNIKKYEFRRKLCTHNIDKIYLYATNPIKGIVGEVTVLEKVTMSKEKLWELAKEEAGITFSYYAEYFNNNERASAYMLGETKRYEKNIPLKDIGILYNPQSYVYISNIDC